MIFLNENEDNVVKDWKVKGSFEVILTSDYDNLDQMIDDWIIIEDDEGYIRGFKIDVFDIEEVRMDE